MGSFFCLCIIPQATPVWRKIEDRLSNVTSGLLPCEGILASNLSCAPWNSAVGTPVFWRSSVKQLFPPSHKVLFPTHQLQVKSMETDPWGRSGENTPGLRITATSHPRHHLIIDLVFHNSLPPRMSYFLGGSFIPTSELKEVQKATPGLLGLLRLAYLSEGKWHRISNWETVLHRSLCCS